MSRKPLIAGNWKMNLNHAEAVTLVQKLAWTLDDSNFDFTKTEVAVFPPFTDIRSVQTLVEWRQTVVLNMVVRIFLYMNPVHTPERSLVLFCRNLVRNTFS